MGRIEEEPIAQIPETPIEDSVRSGMIELLRNVINSARQYETILNAGLEKVDEMQKDLTDRADLHKQITSQLRAVEEAAGILGITPPEEPEQIAESEPFVENWAMLRQEVTDNEKKLVELANAVARKPNLDILQITLSHQIGTLSSFQAQWATGAEEAEQTRETFPSKSESVDTQISEVRIETIKILQEGPLIRTHIVTRLFAKGYERSLITLALDNFLHEDEVIEGGWSTNIAALVSRRGGAGLIFRLRTQQLPENIHYFPRLTREQVVERFKENLVAELARQGKPLTIEEIIDWHKRFEGSRLSTQWYFWKIRELAFGKGGKISIRGTRGKELYAAILHEEGQEDHSDIPF